MDSPKYINQSDLSALLGIDRGRITALQKQGLPYESAGRGKPARYIAPVVLGWWFGRDYAKKRGLNVGDPATLALLGYSLAAASDPDWKDSARRLAGWMNITGSKFEHLFGIVEGIRIGLRLRG